MFPYFMAVLKVFLFKIYFWLIIIDVSHNDELRKEKKRIKMSKKEEEIPG